MSKSFNVTFTSKEGCTVHFVGTVDYSLWHPEVVTIHGTITLGGGPGCPKGTLTFALGSIAPGGGVTPPKRVPDLVMTVDDSNIFRLTTVRFSKGLKSVPRLLATRDVTSLLARELLSLKTQMTEDFKRLGVPVSGGLDVHRV